MVVFEFNGNKFYIDGRLKEQLDKKIIPDLKKKDKDVVFGVDGGEREGKSVFSMILCAYIASQLNSKFDLSNICMHPLEFKQKIENSEKNQAIIYDEAHRGMASARTLTEINKILKDLMMEMGQKNLFVIIVLPSFFLLDKYAALFRTSGLFHIYERKRQRGFWCYFNRSRKLKLYLKGKRDFNYNCMKWPHFRGRFYNQYSVDEEEYREKKRKSFKEVTIETQEGKYKEQRDELIYILYKEGNFKKTDILTMLKLYKIPLKSTQVYDILKEKEGKFGNKLDSE